jgi:hypothetical protein
MFTLDTFFEDYLSVSNLIKVQLFVSDSPDMNLG